MIFIEFNLHIVDRSLSFVTCTYNEQQPFTSWWHQELTEADYCSFCNVRKVVIAVMVAGPLGAAAKHQHLCHARTD